MYRQWKVSWGETIFFSRRAEGFAPASPHPWQGTPPDGVPIRCQFDGKYDAEIPRPLSIKHLSDRRSPVPVTHAKSHPFVSCNQGACLAKEAGDVGGEN